MALDDDIGTTLLLARMDSHAQKQPVGSPLSSHNDTPLKTKTAPLTSASSPSLSLSLIPPPLPQRDARRNSCFLDALLDPKTALTTDATATPAANTTTMTGPPTPLDVYLSSEEDASSIGELSDFEFDDDEYDNYDGEYDEATATSAAVVVRTISNNSAPAAMTATTATTTTSSSSLQDSTASPAPTRRHSHDVARVVSVVYAGKPSLVDLGLERAARRRSLHNGRRASSSSSSVVLSERRPSTSSGGSMLSTAPSSTVSPSKQHKRKSSSGSISSLGGSGMLTSFRARKLAMTASTVTAAANTVTRGRSLAPVLTSLDTTMPPPPSPTGPASATYTSTPVSAPIMAAPARSFTTSALMAAQPTSATSSPRTPTFGTGNLLRGMTRSLTLSGRRGLGRRESMAEKVPAPTSATATPPVLLPAMLPAEAVSALFASSSNYNANSAGNRKSLAMSVVSSMTAMNAPPPGPPNEDGFDENVPRRLAMPPAEIVVSKKSTGSSFLGSLTGRRRSMKLL